MTQDLQPSDKKNTIWYTSLRAFFATMSAVFAAGLGILVLSNAFSAYFEGAAQRGEMIAAPPSFTSVIVSDSKGGVEKLPLSTPILLYVPIEGVIGLDGLTTNRINQMLMEADQGDMHDRVEGVMLYINTPGGTVEDADGIYRALMAFKKDYQVPVYAYVDGLCASGGMYVASAADKIYASDVSLIGSIGVLMPSAFNVSQLMTKLGIQSQTLTAGRGKDELNPFRPWQKDEGRSLQAIVDFYYGRFVDIVTKARPNLSKAKLVADYGAQVFPAPLAKQYGYIDVSGVDLETAVGDLVTQMGIKDDELYQVVKMEPIYTLSDLLMGGQMALKNGVKHTVELPGEINAKLLNRALYLYRP